MRRLSTFVFGVIAGGAFVYAALHYHLVRAADGMHLVPKQAATLAGTYADIRQFGPRDWLEHPQIATAIIEAGQDELMNSAARDTVRNGLDRLLSPDARH